MNFINSIHWNLWWTMKGQTKQTKESKKRCVSTTSNLHEAFLPSLLLPLLRFHHQTHQMLLSSVLLSPLFPLMHHALPPHQLFFSPPSFSCMKHCEGKTTIIHISFVWGKTRIRDEGHISSHSFPTISSSLGSKSYTRPKVHGNETCIYGCVMRECYGVQVETWPILTGWWSILSLSEVMLTYFLHYV